MQEKMYKIRSERTRTYYFTERFSEIMMVANLIRFTHQRFLWPQNVLGRPVMIRMTPRTPKPGSILVSRAIGAAEGDSVDVAVGVRVKVTLKVVGKTVVMVTSSPPDLVTAVVVKLVDIVAVVRDGLSVVEVGVD